MAATFLRKNELGGADSFSEDAGPMAADDWDQVNSSGRPSDFFERKSRNLDHVELSSPRNVDDPLVLMRFAVAAGVVLELGSYS
ncbi:unnamed protein product [Phytophthora fragariaefolia]|uniref:Unnamed protein product n=1 Tax=Phytophthora fragariaefolia TaxID=1490495 RepID=A0A9W6TL10_9STRA|nr:unnamed protein product [Phytophthora fragariaefolia]